MVEAANSDRCKQLRPSECHRRFKLSLPKTHRATRQPPEVIQSHFGTIRTASVLPQETKVRSANGQTARSAFSRERSEVRFDQAALRVKADAGRRPSESRAPHRAKGAPQAA